MSEFAFTRIMFCTSEGTCRYQKFHKQLTNYFTQIRCPNLLWFAHHFAHVLKMAEIPQEIDNTSHTDDSTMSTSALIWTTLCTQTEDVWNSTRNSQYFTQKRRSNLSWVKQHFAHKLKMSKIYSTKIDNTLHKNNAAMSKLALVWTTLCT